LKKNLLKRHNDTYRMNTAYIIAAHIYCLVTGHVLLVIL
jgi:hypothetical protein